MTERRKLIVSPNGHLYGDWVTYYPETRKVDKWQIDYEQNLLQVLVEEIDFHEDLKLGDLFLLLSKNPILYQAFKCSREYTEEAINAKKEEPHDVEYIEFFYKCYEAKSLEDPNKNKIFDFVPQVIGKGTKNDKPSEFDIGYLKPGQYYNCPVKLNRNIIIEDDHDIKYRYDGAVFTLAGIYKGLFDSIAFHGTPAEREEIVELIRRRSKRAKDL